MDVLHPSLEVTFGWRQQMLKRVPTDRAGSAPDPRFGSAAKSPFQVNP
jgi:hypothetical protein